MLATNVQLDVVAAFDRVKRNHGTAFPVVLWRPNQSLHLHITPWGEIAVLGIGMGSTEQAQALRDETGFEGELYHDEAAFAPATYRSFALRSGPATLFSERNDFKPPFRPEVAAAAEAALDVHQRFHVVRVVQDVPAESDNT